MSEQAFKWLDWAREIQALTQTGLTYSQIEYDIQRYRRLEEIAAEMVANYTGFSSESILENFRIQPGYATPKVDVRGAVFRDGKILLVQERSDNGWSLPGGWADVGELPSAMVTREIREESGFEVQVEKVIGIYDANRVTIAPLEFYHAYKIVFLCAITGGQARTSDETLAVDFFALENLPPLSNMRTNTAILEEAFAHLNDPIRPATFD